MLSHQELQSVEEVNTNVNIKHIFAIAGFIIGIIIVIAMIRFRKLSKKCEFTQEAALNKRLLQINAQ